MMSRLTRRDDKPKASWTAVGGLFLAVAVFYIWRVEDPNQWVVLGLAALGGLAIFPGFLLDLARIWKGQRNGE